MRAVDRIHGDEPTRVEIEGRKRTLAHFASYYNSVKIDEQASSL
jgi:hypothetical protein